ncbi:MAG: NAD(P)-dependent oxidoreductase [Bacteroidetes bacterium GWC2_33_15]|nr:MAG: NAD(P)-dependent oxidoreductase [Bacteroidetes bacterium GWA2_33_15]OFX50343.1 MAG: NAD(P)-dependent oxidoreductase [Bacteroidetes bacterium GWC2_33_15]OFX66740.1 MAG: NAD(P)-dependent oxidoreductase [Bacteroidetes bacterium GWB2_32_14]OFX69358.1 MAG: NAD(P)-dependent oxidoreductase [Bacteroidetes bacterium GWD2_33_33]HAN18678.1 NAD(P)-dependent oxidoreductase [Bacteroidales bacterium]
MNRIALITGATSGIGRATALKLAQNNFDIIITGRRIELLDELKKEIKEKPSGRVHILHFDVRDKEQVFKAIDALPKDWKDIDVLVNNAGLAVGLEHLHDGTVDDWERMIDTNVKGLLYMTKKVSAIMVEKNHGHIINIGSTAGKEVYEFGNVYCGTKHAVDAITKGMRIDMLKHKIKVTAINPGMVETEFSLVRFKGDKERAEKVYKGFNPLIGEDIADAILYVLTRPEHVCINDMIITATAQANSLYKVTE